MSAARGEREQCTNERLQCDAKMAEIFQNRIYPGSVL